MAFDLPAPGVALHYVLVAYVVGLAGWNAFLGYGMAAGATDTDGEEMSTGQPADGASLDNEAVPSDHLTERLPSTGRERPYRAMVRTRLVQHLLLGAVPAFLVVAGDATAALDPTVQFTPLVTAGVGAGLGAILFGGKVAVETMLAHRGLRHRSDALSRQLQPTGARQWAIHLGILLPALALVEEVWFRGALIPVVYAATGAPLAVLVPLSAVLFGMPHREQGRTAVLLTTGTGLVYGVALVTTGSLLLVVVAHYTANAIGAVWFSRVG